MKKGCCNCAHWNHKYATDDDGAIRLGFVCSCLAPVSIPTNAPAALKMIPMNWDEGTDCALWELWEGQIKFASWLGACTSYAAEIGQEFVEDNNEV